MRLATDRIARQRSAPDPRPLVVTGRRGNIERLTAVDAAAALRRVGLKRIGDILDLPRAPLAARFGDDVLRQLARALGTEREPLTPLLPVAAYVAEQSFSEPIAREEDVLHVIARLAARLE